MPRLLLFSAKRSGTNWFMDVAGQVPGVLCFRDVFNPGGVFGLHTRDGIVAGELAVRLGAGPFDERDPEVVAFVRGDPEGFLTFAAEAAAPSGITWIGATLFRGHLTSEQVAALLTAPETVAVLLKRRHLDRAVSLAKARRSGRWKHADTTELRPEVPAEDVERAIRDSESWFAEVERVLAATETPALTLTYEDHVLAGAEPTLAALADGCPGFPWAPGAPLPEASVPRQDRGTSPFERIGNGAALRADLSARGLLERALAYPGGSARS